MKTIFVTNGKTRLVLIPERDTEKILVDELMQSGDLVVDVIRGPVDVLGMPAQGGLIIKSTNDKANDQSQT